MFLALLKRVPAVAWFALIVCAVVFGTMHYVDNLQKEVTQTVFEKDSLEAFHAQTILRIARDRKFASRRIVQTELANDSLNKALGTLSRVRAQATVRVDSVSGSTVATVRADTSFKFQQYADPYTLVADFKVRPDGTTAKLDWTVKQDPFRIGARVDCNKDESHGVRSATLTLDLPKYMTASIDSVTQSREVCSGGARVANTGVSRVRAYAEAGTIVGGILVVTKVIHWLVGK